MHFVRSAFYAINKKILLCHEVFYKVAEKLFCGACKFYYGVEKL